MGGLRSSSTVRTDMEIKPTIVVRHIRCVCMTLCFVSGSIPSMYAVHSMCLNMWITPNNVHIPQSTAQLMHIQRYTQLITECNLLPTECQIIKVPRCTECYLLPTECQIIKVPRCTEWYLLPTECQIIKVPLYTECYLLPTECQIIKALLSQL